MGSVLRRDASKSLTKKKPFFAFSDPGMLCAVVCAYIAFGDVSVFWWDSVFWSSKDGAGGNMRQTGFHGGFIGFAWEGFMQLTLFFSVCGVNEKRRGCRVLSCSRTLVRHFVLGYIRQAVSCNCLRNNTIANSAKSAVSFSFVVSRAEGRFSLLLLKNKR